LQPTSKPMHQNSFKSSGFTLIELIVTVSIAAILMSMAIPSFIDTIRSNRLTTYANEFVTALNMARSEAVKRGIKVTITRKGTTSQEWKNGWDIFIDANNNNSYDSTEILIKTHEALPNGYTLKTGASTYKDYAAYLSSGLSSTTFGDTFTLCNGSGTSAPRRTITINALGRPTVDATAGTCP
jgi:type IV fimbrial biogenesis protein FimT